MDASNVIGSRPDGWWRDRDGSVRRLHAVLGRFAAEHGEAVMMVLDAPVEGLPATPGVEVVSAARRGRDGADDEIVRLVAQAAAPGDVTVVTSDGALAGRVRALGAAVEGAGAFRRRLGA